MKYYVCNIMNGNIPLNVSILTNYTTIVNLLYFNEKKRWSHSSFIYFLFILLQQNFTKFGTRNMKHFINELKLFIRLCHVLDLKKSFGNYITLTECSHTGAIAYLLFSLSNKNIINCILLITINNKIPTPYELHFLLF